MHAQARAVTVSALVALSAVTRAEVVFEEPRPPGIARPVVPVRDDASLEALAHALFDRLLALSPIPGPRPQLVVSSDPTWKAKAGHGKVTVTRNLLRLCSEMEAQRGRRSERVREALIAFVLAHELAHLARRDDASLVSRAAEEAVEKDADEQAVGRLVMAGIDLQPVRVDHLLGAIARENGARATPSAGRRRAGVARALHQAKRTGVEWHVGWLLTVAGRFDEAIAFYARVASRYPYPQPMHALAVTRMQAAWRRYPCDEPTLLEWLPPLRYDPRSQVEPFAVRSSAGACGSFDTHLAMAASELAQAPGYPPAQIALASLRLMRREPSLDPTRALGGVTRVGEECPASSDPSRALLEADACQVSLLAQYELSNRDPVAREVAISGLRRLLQSWPSEPSLQFNLARLSMLARREAEAVPLWRSYLEGASRGPYLKEAEVSLSRVPFAGLASPHPQPAPASTPASQPASVSSRLTPSAERCRLARNWRPFSLSSSSAWKYCGDWGDEIVVGKARQTLIRSIAVGSNAWPGAEPPSTRPLFVTTSVIGEEVRVWADEAWVFAEKTPMRVVYFTQPQ